MELPETSKSIYIETAKVLKGHARRIFMARVVKSFGKGGQRRAEAELGWGRGTIRKGMHELESGFECYDVFTQQKRLSDRELQKSIKSLKFKYVKTR